MLAAMIYAMCVAAPSAYAHGPLPEEDDYYSDDFYADFGFDFDKEYDNALDLAIDRLYWGVRDDQTTAPAADEDTEELPKKFDLRDVDGVCYVPEIRNQDPFGTCWSFGAIAASEISIAHDIGLDFNTMTEEEKKLLDLSEKHLAWFSYSALAGDPLVYGSQMGEGYHFVSLDDGIDNYEETYIPYDWGGFPHFASMLFSEGIGPAYEIYVPYLNKDGKWTVNMNILSVDEYNCTEYVDFEIGEVAPGEAAIQEYIEGFLKDHPGLKNYDTEFDGPGDYYSYTVYRSKTGDWSLDESERFQGFFLKESNILPSPAEFGDYGYAYNEAATEAIKRELLAGRGVAVNFHSDQSRPGDIIDPESHFLNFLTEDGEPAEYMTEAAIWAHYTYDTYYDPNDPDSWNGCVPTNHSVCIVGYDDDFPKEYFYDPNGTIGGDGAWIVRNSWGCENNSDSTAVYSWGNNGDGYFYISYYDQSLTDPESYEFSLFDPENMGRSLDIYDLFPSFSYTVATFDTPVYMANVFTSESESVIRDLGVMTALPELDTKLSVYLLEDGFKSPTDGRKVSETEDHFKHKGYHTAKLEEKVLIEPGQMYSVVLEMKNADGRYIGEINCASNKTAHDTYDEMWQENYIYEYGTLEGYVDEDPIYAKLIVNKGESWFGAKDGDTEEWKDLVDVIDIFNTKNIENYDMANLDYDNFPIRSYPYSDMIHAEHKIENEKAVYEAGDVISGTITLKNDTARYTFDDVAVSCTLTDLGKAGKIGEFGPGESRTINYSYTVTEDDLEKGELTSRITLTDEGYNYSFLEEFRPDEYVLKLAEKQPEITEPDSAGETEQAESSGNNTIPLPVIIAGAAAAAVVLVIVVVIVARRKK